MTDSRNPPICKTIDGVKLAIDGIVAEADDTPQLIFRGENKCFEKISSTLYREQEKSIKEYEEGNEKIDEIINDIDVASIQEEDIKDLQKHFSDTHSVFEILAEVQHYRGKTNLIDFSKNFLIALFFACYGESDKPGRLICLDTSVFKWAKTSEKIQYDQSYLFESNSKNNRVIYQNSVFLYHAQGFLNPNDQYIIHIYHRNKKDILQELRIYYGIHIDTIYNDIHGFIEHGGAARKTIAYFNMGLSAQQRKKNELAIKFYTEAIKLNPDMPEAYNNRGNAKSDLGKIENAIKDYDEAIKLNPNYAGAYYNRGNAKVDLGKIEDAIKDYDKAIELKPDYAEAYNNRGNAKSDLGKIEDAIKDYDEAIELKSNFAEAYNNRGNAKRDLGRIEDAIIDYDKAIELKPDFAKAYNNRGNAKSDLGKIEDAIKDYDKAIELNPNYAGAYYNRGNAKVDLGKIEDAIKDYDKAIELKPDFAEAYNNRGNANYTLGKTEQALSDFETFVKLAPNSQHFQYAQKMIDDIRKKQNE